VEPSSAPWRIVDAPVGPDAQPSATPAPTGVARSTLLAATGGIAILLIAAAAIAGGVLPTAPTSNAGLAVEPSGATRETAEIVVEVVGAVASPGVYRLPAGSRIADAVAAAGGFGPRVDAERAAAELNLAAVLEDGARVIVPSRDDTGAGSGSGGPGSDGGGGSGGDGGGLVDLNHATQAELEALPGIGPVTATKIIDSRAGEPFTSVDDLRTRKLVGAKTFESLRDLVTVR